MISPLSNKRSVTESMPGIDGTRKPALLNRWAVFSVCPILGFFRSGGVLGCDFTLSGVMGSSRAGGLANLTRGLGVTLSFRTGLLTTGVSLRLDLSVVDSVAVGLCSIGDPAPCMFFDGKPLDAKYFFAMAAHLSTLLMAILAPGSSSREEVKPNRLGVSLLIRTVA